MSIDNLVKMANQIGQYFASEADRELAVRGVRQHLQSFWTPAMRHDLAAWLAQHPEADLHPLVQEALKEPAESA